MTDPLLARLSQLDSCAISDALDSEGRKGVLLELRPLANAKRIVGRAVTVDLALDTGAATTRHLCTAAVEAAGPSDIIMIAHAGRLHVAGWGGILSTGAVANKVAGVIIDGACRDLDQSRELGLTLYGRGSVPVTARGRIVERDWNVPVTMSGVLVSPGDLVLADGSGVVLAWTGTRSR